MVAPAPEKKPFIWTLQPLQLRLPPLMLGAEPVALNVGRPLAMVPAAVTVRVEFNAVADRPMRTVWPRPAR